MKDFLRICLGKICDQNILFNIESDVIKTYDDSCGQRSAYMEYYGYSKQDPERFPNLFKVRRHLAFTNEEDKGYQGAVLFVLNIEYAKDIHISEKQIKINDLTIYLRESIKFD